MFELTIELGTSRATCCMSVRIRVRHSATEMSESLQTDSELELMLALTSESAGNEAPTLIKLWLKSLLN